MIALYVSILCILFAFFISRSISEKAQKISSTGICQICDQTFEDTSLFEDDGLSFCANHFSHYKNNKWELVETVECSPGNEKDSVLLYEKKQKLYSLGELGFLRSSYKQVNEKIITTLDLYTIKK